ncbi:Myb domain plants domain-containing protein, partial [Dioscorea alata]
MPIANNPSIPDMQQLHHHHPPHHHPNNHQQNQEEDLLYWDDLHLTDIIEGFDDLFPIQTVPPPMEVVQPKQQQQQQPHSMMEKKMLPADQVLVLSKQASVLPSVAKEMDIGVSSESETRPLVVPNRRGCIRGVPWTEAEHRLFLEGLEMYGRSEWRKIARDFVKTRTITQVSTHAKKFFGRMRSKRKKRPSVYDIIS